MFSNVTDNQLLVQKEKDKVFLSLSRKEPGVINYTFWDKNKNQPITKLIRNTSKLFQNLEKEGFTKDKIKFYNQSLANGKKETTFSTKKQLFIFDFDKTITSEHSCKQNGKVRYYEDKLKNGDKNVISELMGGAENIKLFRDTILQILKDGDYVAIVSFGNNDFINKVMKEIFGSSSSPFHINKNIYTTQDFEKNPFKGCTEPSGGRTKLDYIKELLDRNDWKDIKDIFLIDDTLNNIKIVKEKTVNNIPINGIFINNEGKTPGFKNTYEQIKPVI
jgi:2-hydroxy-3-keto-5-methylthiopentenyl-1-phosphate phosphatase